MLRDQWLALIGETDFLRLSLPMPPSVNKYWRWGPSGVYLTKTAKQYRAKIQYRALELPIPRFSGPVVAVLEINPSWRACDLDNFEKCLWDSLEHAGTLVNDSQVACVLRFWGAKQKKSCLTLGLAEVTEPQLVAGLPAWTDQSKPVCGHSKEAIKNVRKKRKPRFSPPKVTYIRSSDQ